MKKIIFALLILVVGSYAVHGQNYGQPYTQSSYVKQSYNPNEGRVLPRPSFELATGIELYNFRGIINDQGAGPALLDPNPSLYFVYSLMVSCNIPVKKIKDNFYLGLNPNIALGYGSGSFTGDVPFYLTLKYGAGSFRGCQKPFGLGVGAGAMVSGVITTLGDVYGDLMPYSTAYIAPAAMAEISFDVGYGNIYQIRTDFTPVPVSKLSASYQGTISEVCIRVMRIF